MLAGRGHAIPRNGRPGQPGRAKTGHRKALDNGVMKMRPVQGGLEIKPGETIELKPESFHLMFVGLKKPLTAGGHIKAALVFEKAGTVNVEYDVLAMGARPSHDMPGMNMPGMKMPGH